MTVEAYLRGTGVGACATFLVPDLTGPHGSPVDLVMVLESPHVDELHAKHPLAGRAGREALAFLAGNVGVDKSLGEEVARRHKNRDFRLAIVNVSQVPLQRQAITSATPLDDKRWIQLEGLRRSQARDIHRLRAPRRRYAESLLADLSRRVALLGIRPATTVAAAGKFAQMFWRSLPSAPACELLEVPHPARRQWARAAGDAAVALRLLRERFEVGSSALPE